MASETVRCSVCNDPIRDGLLVEHMFTMHPTEVMKSEKRFDAATFGTSPRIVFANEVKEAIDHPIHYGGADNPYEHIKVVRAWGLNYELGNATKYICRAGKKNINTRLEDLRKAKFYLEEEIKQEELKFKNA